MSGLTVELILLAVAVLALIDAMFIGVVMSALFALVGSGGWYGGEQPGERVLYRGRHGLGAGWRGLGFPHTVVVTDRRLVIRLAWSRATLVDVPFAAIGEVEADQRGGDPIVRVGMRQGLGPRRVELVSSTADQAAALIAALRDRQATTRIQH